MAQPRVLRSAPCRTNPGWARPVCFGLAAASILLAGCLSPPELASSGPNPATAAGTCTSLLRAADAAGSGRLLDCGFDATLDDRNDRLSLASLEEPLQVSASVPGVRVTQVPNGQAPTVGSEAGEVLVPGVPLSVPSGFSGDIIVCDTTGTLGPAQVTIAHGASRAAVSLQQLRPCPIGEDPLGRLTGCTHRLHKPRVLVDASRDGGTWWFPQLPGAEDPNAQHQGSRLADHIRPRAFVDELPREAWVDAAYLACQDLVVRAGEYAPAADGDVYHESEVASYLAYVAAGGRLLLLSDFLRPGSQDQLAAAFGLELAGVAGTGQATVHFDGTSPLTDGVGSVTFFAGTCAVGLPSGAEVLAHWADEVVCDLDGDGVQDPGERRAGVAAARFSHGLGEVVWLADTNALQPLPQPLVDNILAHMGV